MCVPLTPQDAVVSLAEAQQPPSFNLPHHGNGLITNAVLPSSSDPCCVLEGLQAAGLGEGPGWAISSASGRFHPTAHFSWVQSSVKTLRSANAPRPDPSPFSALVLDIYVKGM